jgi:hypothetical protein
VARVHDFQFQCFVIEDPPQCLQFISEPRTGRPFRLAEAPHSLSAQNN